MKKRILTGIILAGTVAVTTGLAGCGGGAQPTRQAVTKDSLLEKAADTFASMESVDADLDINMFVKMSSTGFNMEIKNNSEMEIEGCNDGSSHVKGHLNLSAIGQEKDADFEMYTVKEGDELIKYSKTTESGNEGVWTYTKTGDYTLGTAEEFDTSRISEAVQKLQNALSELKLHEGTIDYNNVNCYLMDGTISGKKLAQVMGETVTDMDKTTLESYKMLDFDTSLYFRSSDETPYAIVIDMGKAIEKLIASQSDQMQGMNMDISAEDMKISIILNSLNDVKEISVPGEVKNSAIESTEAFNMQDIMGIYGQYGLL